MKTLVLVFHPHLEKSQVNRKLMDAANETGDVTVVDEYAAYPDFKINVEHEQELIETHDRIVLQFPFYWYSSPARDHVPSYACHISEAVPHPRRRHVHR